MATQATTLNVGNNPEAARENMRTLISYSNKRLPAYRYWGDMDDDQMGKDYTQDYNVPSKIDSAELDGVKDDNDVVQKTTAPTQVINQKQDYVRDARVGFSSSGRAIPGNLGDLTRQEEQLMLRAMTAIDNHAVSNIASRKATTSAAGRAGSPITFIGDGTNALTTNDGIISVATTTALTAGGGYDSTGQVSRFIDDDTTAGNRANIKLSHILEAVENIYEALDSATGEGRLRDKSYVAFIPSSVYTRMFLADNTGILEQTRYTTRVGGALVEIQAHVTQLDSPYGPITLLPVTNQIGGGSNNVMGMVFCGSATDIVYKERPYTKQLDDSQSQEHTTVRASFSFRPPHATAGVAIIGCIQ